MVYNVTSKNPIVSICCTTYNHANYIRQAFDGFLMQKTSFSFEVLIHDDASTDGTDNIIKEYEEKFPTIIKPIYQTENQYSQKKEILSEFLFPLVQGKYIAICEGDDYWTDPLKLQKQVDAIEQNNNIDICFHPARKIIESTGYQVNFAKHSNRETVFSANEVIERGGGFMPTASILFRADILNRLPSFFNTLAGDYILQSYASLRGGALFLPEVMSVYRMFTVGSWSESLKKEKGILLYIESMENRIANFSNYLGDEYQESLNKYKAKVLFSVSQTLLTNRSKKYVEVIEKSWNAKRKISLKQTFFFKMRRHDKFLNKILLIESLIRKLKNKVLLLNKKIKTTFTNQTV